MKILHILRSPRAEGTVKLTLDWLGEHSVHQEVFVLESEPAEMTQQLRGRARWYDEAGHLPSGAKKYLWMFGVVRRVCVARRPDLMICWANGFSPWIMIAARFGGVARLVTHAGNPPNWNLGGKAQTVLSTFTAWLAGGKMVCCSRYVASEFARSPGAFASVLKVVHNCAPVSEIRAAAAVARARRTDWRLRLIMVATLESHKDHATLLRAMLVVIRAMPGVQLWLAGDGSLRRQLSELSAAMGLGEIVTFLGSRGDVPTLLGQSDLFVFSTTRQEGLGSVLIEALAAGLPVVASDVPACREVLAQGHWGTLVPPANPEALAAGILEALRIRTVASRNDSEDYLRRFTPATMMAGYFMVTEAL